MIDYVVKQLLMIIGEGGTECSFAKNEIINIIHTLEKQYGYEMTDEKYAKEYLAGVYGRTI